MAEKLSEFQRLERLRGWRDQELARQATNRFQMALDEDFYDGLQWSPDEAAELMRRGQAPVVYNQIKPTIDWLIGTERRLRIDYKIAPVGKEEAALETAQAKTKLMKYIQEQNRANFRRSSAFEDAIKAGVGWREVGVRADPEDEPIYVGTESWRNVLYDSLSVDPDYSDARYLFRLKVVDTDIACAYFPKKEEEIKKAAESTLRQGGFDWWFGRRLSDLDDDPTLALPSRFSQFDAAAWIFNPRERVTLYECWYFEPTVESTNLGGGTFDRVRMKLRCAVFTDSAILIDMESPYKHNKIPFAPSWCYRRRRDNAPYGAIRNIRGPQEALNKRQSKALWAISVNQFTVENDAIDPASMDLEEIREEVSAPDGGVVLAPGGLSKFRREKNLDIAQANLAMAERDQIAIREVGGVTSENLGRDTNLVSGIALERKQQQGQQVTAQMFDNLRLSDQIVGEQMLALAEQYYTEPKVFRVTGERSKHEFIEINSIDETTGQPVNPISAFKSQFIIDEQDYRASLRQAMFESLMDLLAKIAAINPQFAANTLDVVLEYADVQGRETIVKRIRDLNGQRDPESPMTPEEEQKKTAQQQMTAETEKLNLDLLRAKVTELQGKAKKMDVEGVLQGITALYTALQAGQVVATVPGVAPVADEIARAAGFQDAGGVDPNIPSPAMHAAAPIAPPMQADGSQRGIQTPQPDGVIV